jgi:hypothetical protein
MFVALAMGLLSQMPGHSHGIADIAPADFVANQLVAAAELVARRGPGPRALLISHATTSGNASSLAAPLRWRVCNFEVPRMIAQVRTYLLTYLLPKFLTSLLIYTVLTYSCYFFLPSFLVLPSFLTFCTYSLSYLLTQVEPKAKVFGPRFKMVAPGIGHTAWWWLNYSLPTVAAKTLSKLGVGGGFDKHYANDVERAQWTAEALVPEFEWYTTHEWHFASSSSITALHRGETRAVAMCDRAIRYVT